MMKAYSMDLRERVLAASDAGLMTIEEIAETFQVSLSWIGKLRKRVRDAGLLSPKPHEVDTRVRFRVKWRYGLLKLFKIIRMQH